MGITAIESIEKQPSETINISMNFATTGLLDSSVTISGPTASIEPNDGNLTISNLQVSGQSVLLSVAAGVNNTKYRVQITVDTSDDQIISGDGILMVRGK